jgi:F-type H+-transporting ATPase subunit epsilon
MTLHVTITTPERVLVDTEAQEVIIPTTVGVVSILPGHTELVSQVKEGIVTVLINGREEHFAIAGGFLTVNQKQVDLLADFGVSGKDRSEIEVEEARKRAEKAMQEHRTDEDFALAESEFKRTMLELQAIRRHKNI